MSDLARVYPNGQELAVGGQTGGTVAVNGKEMATPGNSGLAHSQGNGKEITK